MFEANKIEEQNFFNILKFNGDHIIFYLLTTLVIISNVHYKLSFSSAKGRMGSTLGFLKMQMRMHCKK